MIPLFKMSPGLLNFLIPPKPKFLPVLSSPTFLRKLKKLIRAGMADEIKGDSFVKLVRCVFTVMNVDS